MFATIFKAYDIRGTYPDPLGEQEAWRIGWAAGRFFKNQNVADQPLKLPDTVLVSQDMRPSGRQLAPQLMNGLRASGLNVIDLGMCDTSIIYFAVNSLGALGGIQTTASHNPAQYNGFKISGYQARPIGADTGLQEIHKIAESITYNHTLPVGSLGQRDVWDDYRKHILSFYEPGHRKLKVFIDASNGMAGKLVPKVFHDLNGLDIVPLNFEITGSFVHEPNPLVAENMQPTQRGVIEHSADLGVCFDGDADRCILTDEQGTIIGCDHLTALLTQFFVAKDPAPGSTVVYDLRSSRVLEETIRACGAKPKKCRVGHVFMKAMLRQTGGVFGGELSGHFYFRDNYFADSGAIALAAALSVLSATDKPMSQLIRPFIKYPQSGEINFQVEDKYAVLQSLQKTFTDAAIDHLDGVTIDLWDAKGFWLNVRPSNTEPLLRLNAEAKDQTLLNDLLAELQPLLGNPG